MNLVSCPCVTDPHIGTLSVVPGETMSSKFPRRRLRSVATSGDYRVQLRQRLLDNTVDLTMLRRAEANADLCSPEELFQPANSTGSPRLARFANVILRYAEE